MFCFSWLNIIIRTLHLLQFRHHICILDLLALVGVRLGLLDTNQSDRSSVTGLTGQVRLSLILQNRAYINEVTLIFTLEACPCSCTLLFLSWRLLLVLGFHRTCGLMFHVWLLELNKTFPFSLTLLRSKGSEVLTLLKLLHHVVTVILRRLHLTFTLQLDHFNP